MDAAQVRIGKVVDELVEECQKQFYSFLENFEVNGEKKYQNIAKRMQDLEKVSMPISYNDLMAHAQVLSKYVMLQYYKLLPYLCKTTQKFINDLITDTLNDGKEYLCHFIDFPTTTTLRDLKSNLLGKLTKFRGQVIRSHPVHPELVLGTFKCCDCGTTIKNVPQQFIYTQPKVCYNSQCRNRKSFELIKGESKFVDFQKVRVQETQGELPRGSVPRSMDVILRYNVVEMAQPGDQADFIGTLIVIPDVSQISIAGSKTVETRPIRQAAGYDSGVTGLKSLGVRELNYSMAFLASYVATVDNKLAKGDPLLDDDEDDVNYEALQRQMTEEQMDQVMRMSEDSRLLDNLCSSLFPGIYGLENVKKGILLMLFGGVSKVTGEGTRLRGDINVLVLGDPSTAKSQFLKRIEQFAPRAVYTSGKASSAAGLTAAVVKDPESSEYVIEAGALMLANNGICCIDEFDKMDVRDQVAIHEAMEQQTISITKAGVKATLNARTSILAAANPVNGRYDQSRPLRHNIALSEPIMSRFDLVFVLVDESNEEIDRAVADRILDKPQGINNTVSRQLYTDDQIRRFLSLARCFRPRVTVEALEVAVTTYKRMRDRDDGAGQRSACRVTVRQLESLLRLAEACARARFSDEVTAGDVREADALMREAQVRVKVPPVELGPANQGGEDGATVSMSYEDYFKVTGALIEHMRTVEYCSRTDLVNWYLETVLDTVGDVDALLRTQAQTETIVQRLIDRDEVLLAMTAREEEDGAEVVREVITLHPNVPMV